MGRRGRISGRLRRWGNRLLPAATVVVLAVPGAAAQAVPDSIARDGPVLPPAASTPDSTTPAPAVEPVTPPSPAPETRSAEPGPRPAAGSRKVRLIGEGRNVVRSGPGDRFALAGAYDKG
ncbi:MAG: hypothetical protein ACRENJ_07560, partial [Candidatus Eiseniibacteriota bacterium]